jgi:hypothetical protein
MKSTRLVKAYYANSQRIGMICSNYVLTYFVHLNQTKLLRGWVLIMKKKKKNIILYDNGYYVGEKTRYKINVMYFFWYKSGNRYCLI